MLLPTFMPLLCTFQNRRYGNVSLFSQQRLEKLNDTTRRNYFRSTNHRESEAMKQLMEKQNHLEHLEDEGYR